MHKTKKKLISGIFVISNRLLRTLRLSGMLAFFSYQISPVSIWHRILLISSSLLVRFTYRKSIENEDIALIKFYL